MLIIESVCPLSSLQFFHARVLCQRMGLLFYLCVAQIQLKYMHLTSDNKFKKLVVIGDRVLIRPSKPNERTDTGLYLTPGVQEKEKVQQGYIIKTSPGYAIPFVDMNPGNPKMNR